MKDEERIKIITRTSAITMTVNALLAVMKLAVGVFARSHAIISDGVDSLADVFTTGILIAGVIFGKKSKDDDHPYGHEKLESIASILLAAALAVTAAAIGVRGIKAIAAICSGQVYQVPGAAALAAALVSIAAKEAMFRYVRASAKRTDSTALMANAWNFRSDSLASIGSLIGIGGAMLGFNVLDPIMSIIIALMVVKVAAKIGVTGINEVTDHAASPETQRLLLDTIAAVDGVWYIDELKTRQHGSRLIIDVAIAVNADITVKSAHDIADNVSNAVLSHKSGIKECMVHVNPYQNNEREEGGEV